MKRNRGNFCVICETNLNDVEKKYEWNKYKVCSKDCLNIVQSWAMEIDLPNYE
ncbi:hypothetical protein [Mycoplasmopsis lipofaciens]|uniref:hypothetical protein n=1 Tax=Mycoplasmopsis lipofaciens TaxID=114884 RepID=UPI000A8F3166|nr:hypothetical protein [Mycoplasmopsis lipofaciens]